METLADALERALRFVRETRAPLIAASWALVAFLVSGFLIRLRQDNFGWKLGTSLLAFGGAAGALLWWSLQPEHEPYAYKFVDEVVALAPRFKRQGRLIDVHGCVVPGSIERRRGTDEYRFRLASRPDRPPAVIKVRYTGVLPDAFRSEAEIVAKGRLAADGGVDVVPDGIMARCPSKYAADPNAPPYDWRCAEP